MPNMAIPKYTVTLPATPCVPEMREDMLEQAKARGVSLAEVQRLAFSLFLAGDCSKSTVNCSKATESITPRRENEAEKEPHN